MVAKRVPVGVAAKRVLVSVAAQSVHRAVVRTRGFCALTVAMARGVGAYGVAMTLVGIASYAAAQPRPLSPQDRVGVPGPRVGCDPYMMRQPEAVPAAQRATCGDGRARSGVLSCWRDCTGGCDGVSGCVHSYYRRGKP